MRHPVVAGLLRVAAGRRFPTLFTVMAGLFVLDLLVPDLIPLADELLLSLLALLFACIRRRPAPPAAGPRDQR